MSPLSLGTSSQKVPTEFGELLDLLDSRPQPALVYYDGHSAAEQESPRIELSGRVLANWSNKLTGLLLDEHDLSGYDSVLIDMSPHWKAAAVALAAGSIGAEVQMLSRGREASKREPSLIITDRPMTWIDGDSLRGSELAAFSLGMLDGSYQEATGVDIPAWVTDISAEARQYPDQLLTPLPPVALPESGAAEPRRQLVLREWEADSFNDLLGTWAGGGVVVLFDGPEGGESWDQMLRNEGISARSS